MEANGSGVAQAAAGGGGGAGDGAGLDEGGVMPGGSHPPLWQVQPALGCGVVQPPPDGGATVLLTITTLATDVVALPAASRATARSV